MTTNTLPIIEANYDIKINLGNKEINCRKWKGKDRKDFKKALEKEPLTNDTYRKYLVYSCILETDVYLNDDELDYILIEIRRHTLGDKFNYTFLCHNEECGHINTITDETYDNILNITLGTNDSIIIGDYTFNMGQINKAFYEKILAESKIDTIEEKAFIELVLSIHSVEYDGEKYDAFDYKDMYNFLESLEADTFDKLYNQYTINKFNCIREKTYKCEKCGSTLTIEYDEIPEFFNNWFE